MAISKFFKILSTVVTPIFSQTKSSYSFGVVLLPNLIFGRGRFCSNECARFEKKLQQVSALFKYVNLGNQFNYKKYNQKLHHVEYYDGKWKQNFLPIFRFFS